MLISFKPTYLLQKDVAQVVVAGLAEVLGLCLSIKLKLLRTKWHTVLSAAQGTLVILTTT